MLLFEKPCKAPEVLNLQTVWDKCVKNVASCTYIIFQQKEFLFEKPCKNPEVLIFANCMGQTSEKVVSCRYIKFQQEVFLFVKPTKFDICKLYGKSM